MGISTISHRSPNNVFRICSRDVSRLVSREKDGELLADNFLFGPAGQSFERMVEPDNTNAGSQTMIGAFA